MKEGGAKMKKKLMLAALSMLVAVSVLAGCSSKTADSKPAGNAATPTPTEASKPDTTASASVATDEASFEKLASKDGNFIILTKGDLTLTKDITVDGTFTKKDKDGKEVVTRSLAFATSNPDHSVNQRFTVTVPNLIINSPNTLLEDGIVKGDVYVQTEGFTTKDTTIDGNLHFATQALMDAFKKDDLTKVNGTIDVKAYTK
jgi:hypothetical protein